MYEQFQLLLNYLRMAWLYRWIGVALAVAACMGGWIFVYLMPDEYEVQTKVYLDSSSMLRPLLKGLAFDSTVLRNSSLMLRRTLLTRPNLEDVARRADLDLKADTPTAFDEIVTELVENIEITTTKKDDIFDIRFTAEEPELAKRVVDELLNVFLEASLGDTRRDSAVSQRFIDEQIAEYEKRLLAAEERVKEFKQRNIGVMPGSQGGFYNKLQEAHNVLNQAELELREATRRRDDIKEMSSFGAEDDYGDEEESLLGNIGEAGVSSPEVMALDARIQTLNEQIDSLLIEYTEKHPDVQGARRTIEVIERKKEKKVAQLQQELRDNPPELGEEPSNPYEQELKLQVVQAEAMVGALQTRVKEYQDRVADLEQKVDTVPEVEAELARLNRDYSINRDQYEELLQRRELAHLSQEADATAEDVKIRVIEPPRLPINPVGPPRLLFISATLGLALSLGAAISFALSQLNPRIIGDADVRLITALPILGAVGMVENPIHRRQRRMEVTLFGLSISALIAVYIGQVLLINAGIDLHERFNSFTGASL